MPDSTTFGIYLLAAFILAVTPGPGIFYVLTRSIKGGRGEGVASTFGTAVGGLFHIIAAALGLSAILATSAVAFGLVKYAGAAYLVYLGIHTLLKKEEATIVAATPTTNSRHAFRQGVITEALNPKTALFFLAFIPQFINPAGPVVGQFIFLGSISVLFNSAADLVVAFLAGPLGKWLMETPRLRLGQRLFSGCALIALGTYVAFADDR